MDDERIYETAFAGRQHLIRALRKRDAAFDEICSDFTSLYRELASVEQAIGAAPNRHAADLHDSLSGLRCEIEGRLRLLSEE